MHIDQTYDQYGRLATQVRSYTYINSTHVDAVTEYEYDWAGRVTAIVHEDDESNEISSFEYTYNAAGQLTSQTKFQCEIDNDPVVLDYTYDGQGQLTDDDVNTYSYDLGGNRNTSTTFYTDLESNDTNRLKTDATWEYDYDDAGNLTKKSQGTNDETWTYGYDHRNQLIEVQKWDKDPDDHSDETLLLEADYKYDIFGPKKGVRYI